MLLRILRKRDSVHTIGKESRIIRLYLELGMSILMSLVWLHSRYSSKVKIDLAHNQIMSLKNKIEECNN